MFGTLETQQIEQNMQMDRILKDRDEIWNKKTILEASCGSIWLLWVDICIWLWVVMGCYGLMGGLLWVGARVVMGSSMCRSSTTSTSISTTTLSTTTCTTVTATITSSTTTTTQAPHRSTTWEHPAPHGTNPRNSSTICDAKQLIAATIHSSLQSTVPGALKSL